MAVAAIAGTLSFPSLLDRASTGGRGLFSAPTRPADLFTLALDQGKVSSLGSITGSGALGAILDNPALSSVANDAAPAPIDPAAVLEQTIRAASFGAPLALLRDPGAASAIADLPPLDANVNSITPSALTSASLQLAAQLASLYATMQLLGVAVDPRETNILTPLGGSQINTFA
jgi:hypothetical protein